jgi:hypothetical protein
MEMEMEREREREREREEVKEGRSLNIGNKATKPQTGKQKIRKQPYLA